MGYQKYTFVELYYRFKNKNTDKEYKEHLLKSRILKKSRNLFYFFLIFIFCIVTDRLYAKITEFNFDTIIHKNFINRTKDTKDMWKYVKKEEL